MSASESSSNVAAELVGVLSLLERGVSIDTILAAIVDEVVRRLEADRGTLYLVDRDRKQIFSKAAHLPELREIRLDFGQGLAGSVAVTGKLVNMPDPYADTRFENSVDKRTGYVTRSMLVAPIRDRAGDLIGVLQVLNKKTDRFTTEDEASITTLATQAGQVIESTSLYADLRARPAAGRPRGVDYRYNRIIGASKVMQRVYELVDKAATTDATVLVQGESGTGKGLIARAIHVNSSRRDKPLVKVDCAALPPSLIENELFGHEKGAYTSADKATPGKLELAEGGTLFIDEVGELPAETQGKLLRVIQEHEFERVGGTRTLSVDFRIVAATNRNLEAMVKERSFREDLYYRIRVVRIELPPLRERGSEDVTRLAEHFLDVFAKKHQRGIVGFTPEAMTALIRHTWPGNIRELENCVESAVVLADGARIRPEHLALPAMTAHVASAGNASTAHDLSKTLAQAERAYIDAMLEGCQGNQSEAARRLGISRNTLARKLK